MRSPLNEIQVHSAGFRTEHSGDFATPATRQFLCGSGCKERMRLLGASHAGTWYPTGVILTQMLRTAVASATVTPAAGHLRAVILPHAGYVYCLTTSAHALS